MERHWKWHWRIPSVVKYEGPSVSVSKGRIWSQNLLFGHVREVFRCFALLVFPPNPICILLIWSLCLFTNWFTFKSQVLLWKRLMHNDILTGSQNLNIGIFMCVTYMNFIHFPHVSDFRSCLQTNVWTCSQAILIWQQISLSELMFRFLNLWAACCCSCSLEEAEDCGIK